MKTYKRILIIIVFSQFCCTTLWFASNAVINQLISNFNLSHNALGHLTSAVNFGFIIGTLVYAIFNFADRFSPSRVFFVSAVIASLFNLACILDFNTLSTLLSYRFGTGFFLAGIYPVGMKIAADYSEAGLGKALGFLVGALVLGTASPHILNEFSSAFSWKLVFILTSILALLGGALMQFLVPNGPYRKPIAKTDVKAFITVFKNTDLRKAAFGYFGHMWELFGFWAFIPVMLVSFNTANPAAELNVPVLSFTIIAMGTIASIVGGYISEKKGVKNTALFALAASFLCCLLSPLFFRSQSVFAFVIFMCFWGMVVITDSPMFSTLVANSVSAKNKGTAITIVNCIGFAISIISIQITSLLIDLVSSSYVYMFLALGPLFGLLAFKIKKLNKQKV
ncbi:MFS transporter [Postechiella marina]|uniref:MFS transporter n=1 Tax=Postechiella marina TaxID=943941 RepID=A0ABP8CD27_9FLAO